MNNNSPVPEWFGRAKEEPAKSPRAWGIGCSLLVLFLLALVSSVAIYFAVHSRARAERLERDLAAARQRASSAQSAMQTAESTPTPMSAPKPVPAAPARDAAPLDAAAEAGHKLDAGAEAGHKLGAGAIQQVLRPLRPKFRKCYEAALAKDPNAEGRLRLKVRIAPSGRVESVQTTTHGGLAPAVGRCVSATLRAARFPVSGQSTTVSLPLTFQPG